ncbi:MAG: prepilin-type N-terminal cleavage/methylation domain-containing protein [Rhodocyclaceae bacterium]|nr:prepilin-type N-terminal cleavage/methylation domain-containing protein [Rhodocyclaceae bacterium]
MPAGFTLIELMVVLALVGALLSIALPRYVTSVKRSAEVVLRHNLKATRRAIDQYYGDRGVYPRNLRELVQRGYLDQMPTDPVLDSRQRWLLELAPDGGVMNLRSSAEGVDSDGRRYRDL